MKARVAILDDEERLAQVLGMVLTREGYDTTVFSDARKFLQTLGDEGHWDLVVTDLKMPGVDGLGVLEAVLKSTPSTPVILITAHGTVETAIEAMKRGAYDYVQKPFDNDELKALAKRALERTRLTRENRYLRAEVRSKYALENVVAEAPAMQAVFDLANRAARSPATVLVTGDSGTGKELVARSVHYWSDRVGQPFVAVNCKAFASGVLESELFGHEKGAFTGAQSARAGVFERADGGTVFLDEIGEVDTDFQGKLLRVLQEREVQRVGGDHPKPIDVRIVAATNRDLKAEVATAASAKTSTTVSTSSRLTSRRCVSDAPTSCRWPATSSSDAAGTWAATSMDGRPRSSSTWHSTTGRGTCVSSRTRSSARSCSPVRRCWSSTTSWSVDIRAHGQPVSHSPSTSTSRPRGVSARCSPRSAANVSKPRMCSASTARRCIG